MASHPMQWTIDTMTKYQLYIVIISAEFLIQLALSLVAKNFLDISKNFLLTIR